jgi:uncharacterized membrane protein
MVKKYFLKIAFWETLLSTVFLSPLFAQETSRNQPQLQCFGTEPFWVASVYSDRTTFTLLGEETLEIKGELLTPAGVSSKYAQNFVSETVIIASLSGQCNDGMSDRLYARQGLVQFLEGKKIGLIGCCQPTDITIETE